MLCLSGWHNELKLPTVIVGAWCLSVPKVWQGPWCWESLGYDSSQSFENSQRTSAGGRGEEGTKSWLILTPELTKGNFLMSLKHRFLIRDVRPISHKREKQQPQTLKQLTGALSEWKAATRHKEFYSEAKVDFFLSSVLFPEQRKQAVAVEFDHW